ncbi:MAG: hypothetical protein KME16_17495 [Scytolyngbya sp. HA4215-MV1]|jgi:hypothetical protein|nr:hypothetical protein [Scytolyngbya sp. HA4215-MV1]
MFQPIYCSYPLDFSRYAAITALKDLPIGTRLTFDGDTYVIRAKDHYVAYRTWMNIFPLIEVFTPNCESAIVSWLEQFGHVFSSHGWELKQPALLAPPTAEWN